MSESILDLAYKTLHYCDYCSHMICEEFTEPVGVIHSGKKDEFGLWMCDGCQREEFFERMDSLCPGWDQPED